jgi:hypothetical protein
VSTQLQLIIIIIIIIIIITTTTTTTTTLQWKYVAVVRCNQTKGVRASTDCIRGNEGSILVRLALPKYAVL